MDFVSDALFQGRRLRALAVIENCSCECLAIDVGRSLKGEDVVRTLERIKAHRGLPHTIKVDNGSKWEIGGRPVSLRFGSAPALRRERVDRRLWWATQRPCASAPDTELRSPTGASHGADGPIA